MFVQLIAGAQNTATIYGKVRTDKGLAVDLVNIAVVGYSGGTTSNARGSYVLEIPADTTVVVVFSHIEYKLVRKKFDLKQARNKK